MGTLIHLDQGEESDRRAEDLKQARRLRAATADPDCPSPQEEPPTSDDDEPG